MSATLRATLVIEHNGAEVRRISRSLSVDEVQSFEHEKATGGGYASLPIGELSSLQFLLLESVDRAITLRLNGQSDAGLNVNAGGFVLLVNAPATAGASTNATIDNSSGSTANLRGIAGGT